MYFERVWMLVKFFVLILFLFSLIGCSDREVKEIDFDKEIFQNKKIIFQKKLQKLNGDILYSNISGDLEVYFCEHQIYEFGSLDSESIVGSTSVLIELDFKEKETCDLKIILAHEPSESGINPFYQGKEEDLILFMIQREIPFFIAGIFSILSFVYILIFFFSRRKGLFFYSIEALILCLGFYSFSSSIGIIYLLFPNFPNSLFPYFTYQSLYLVPVFLIFLAISLINRQPNKIEKFVIGYFSAHSIIPLLTYLFKVHPEISLSFFHFGIILSVPVMISFSVYIRLNHKKEFHIIWFGLGSLVLFTLIEISLYYYNEKRLLVPILPYGIFLLILSFIRLASVRSKELNLLESSENLEVEEVKIIEEEKKPEEERQIIRLSTEEEKELKLKLDQLLEIEKIYRDSELNLDKLAEKLKIRTDQVSYLINHEYKTSFRKLINDFRVKESVQLIEAEKDFTLLHIAFEVGFNSKTIFNNEFKRVMGTTPSEYKKNQKNEK